MSEQCSVQEKNIDLIIGNGNQHADGEAWYKNVYIIPNYQRGYRWTRSEVRQLLRDIQTAMTASAEKYCLQPVVVLKDGEYAAGDEELFFFGEERAHTCRRWQVIDGQQRLTTVFLILQYLSSVDATADCYTLQYETRTATNEKLARWTEDVINYNPRRGSFPMITFREDDHLDIYYMASALEEIQAFFADSGNDRKKHFNEFLRNNVFMLWYEFDIEGQKEQAAISLFARINMGKIPLTVAELLKAILLKKKPYTAEIFSSDDDPALIQQKQARNKQMQQLAEEQQYQRAVEWDAMEHLLAEDNFFRFICAEKTVFETRMDYLFRLEYLLDTDMQASLHPDKDEIFRYYEDRILQTNDETKTDALWERLVKHVYLLQEWYNDREAFHKIGFIAAMSASGSAMAIAELIRLYAQSEGKQHFYEEVLDEQIRIILQQKLKDKRSDVFCLEDLDDLTYESNKNEIQTVLLLFNVLTAKQSPDYRFSFEHVYPLEDGASVEHIFPQTPRLDSIVNTYKSADHKQDASKQKQEAVERFVAAVTEEFVMLGKAVPPYNTLECNDDTLARWWSDVLDVLGIDSAAVQGLGNMALISKNLNTKLTNKMFFAKQEKIKQFDKAGEFIPICTHNAFLKYYSIGDGTRTSGVFWEDADMVCHLNSMKDILSGYLPAKPQQEEGDVNA